MTKKTFGTFAGVFTPTTLTILGVIMYIRQPWVVGNAGIVGALGIILISVAITLTTALSLSSITTNVRIGTGGAFSIISKSLGLEIGGAIGIPFYIAQALAVAMYVFGFREGLVSILPNLNHLMLDVIIFSVVMAVAFISTSFAFKIQYVILGIIGLSLISIYGALFVNDLNYDFQLFGTYPGSIENNFSGTSFWVVFAVFFPAVTGVMAGANMSGDLTSPRKSIPKGTISAVILTTIIYISLIFVASLLATPDEMTSNYNLFIDKALYSPIVLAGLLGATLSSALGSFIGAPRIMLALAEKGILPKSKELSKTSKKGEPINSMLITAVIVFIGISLRDLNTIAPILTMFFMITYAMVNIVVLVEQLLGLPSYRPTLKVPLIVPALGAFGSIVIMFVINVIVALTSLILIFIFYFYLVNLKLKSEAGDSRSGLFTALAEWATKKSSDLSPQKEVRSWRPDLLIPMSMPKEIRSSYKLIHSIVFPKGSIKILSIFHENPEEQKNIELFLNNASQKYKESGISVSYAFVENKELNTTINISMQSLNAAFFKPNIIFATIDTGHVNLDYYNQLIMDVKKNNFGMILYIPYSTASLAIEKNINLWLTDIPTNWKETFNVGHNDLSTLLSLLICKNWKGTIDAFIIDNNPDLKFSESDLESFKTMIRFPNKTNINVKQGEILNHVKMHRNADVNIFSVDSKMTTIDMISIVSESRISGIFCVDSNLENVLV
ncbi:amino acid permease [Algibacter sp.]|uniref:amino acid permease n=1 Tax=Algibacter sp. TaxID=1872428 RepID=UPI003C7353C1